jgi:hypothetical protein
VGAIILAALVAGFLSLSVLNRWSARVRTSDLRDL